MRSTLTARPGLRRILHSTAWLAAERAMRLGVGLLIGVWLARHFGPDGFGALAFATAFCALLQPAAALGLEAIVVRMLVNSPERTREILGTAFRLRVAAGLVVFAATCAASFALRPGDASVHWMIALVAASTVLQSVDVVDWWHQARMRPAPVAAARGGAFVLSAWAKAMLVMHDASIEAIAGAILLEAVATAGLLALAARRSALPPPSRCPYDPLLAGRLLREGAGLMFAALSVILYLRIDQIMLGQMLGDHVVGQYTAATRIVEAACMFPVIAVASAAPALIRLKESDARSYRARLAELMRVIAVAGLVVALGLAIAAEPLVALLYGPAFLDAAGVMQVHAWVLPLVGLGVVQSRWLVIEGLSRFAFQRALSGALVNVALNLVLIPSHGAVGAAWATLAAQLAVSVVFNLSSSRTRPILRIQWYALTGRTPA
jgi:PST family polysaccharide transporter